MILNNQQWNQIATWRIKFIEPSFSHIKQLTGMKQKKDEVNQYAKQCESFYRKNTICGVDMCMILNFKRQQ